MTTRLFRDLVLARAMAIEPIWRAICPDRFDTDMRPFAQRRDRWQHAARHAAQSTRTTAAHATPAEPDDADLP